MKISVLKKGKRMRYYHLIPTVGIIWVFIDKEAFDENNPFSDRFTNSDFTKDPFIYCVWQTLSSLIVVALLLITYYLVIKI